MNLECHAAFVEAILPETAIPNLLFIWPYMAHMMANMSQAAHLIGVVISVCDLWHFVKPLFGL